MYQGGCSKEDSLFFLPKHKTPAPAFLNNTALPCRKKQSQRGRPVPVLQTAGRGGFSAPAPDNCPLIKKGAHLELPLIAHTLLTRKKELVL